MAESKITEDDPDLEIDDEILYYSIYHMREWGYLQSDHHRFADIPDRLEIFKYFKMDYFTREGGESNWKAYLAEMKYWSNEDSFMNFFKGVTCVNKEIALELRKKMIPTLRRVGVWMAIYDLLGWRRVNEAKALELLRQYADHLDFEYAFDTHYNYKNLTEYRPEKWTILQHAIKLGNKEFCELVLDLKGPNALNLEELCEFSKKSGQWHIYQKFEAARLGQSVFVRIEKEKVKVERTNAMVNEFMRPMGDEKNQDAVMQAVCDRIVRSIKEHKPISDEFLLIAWRHSTKMTKDPLDSSLWNALREVCLDTLTIPLNKVNWQWFKLYVLDSAIWFQRLESGGLLYDELIKLVEKQWSKPKEYLKKHITKIENSKEWAGVIDIEDVTPKLGEVRQNEDYGTHFEPVSAELSERELRSLSLQAGQPIASYYDMTGYLSAMVIRAYELDSVFHDGMRKMFNIDVATNADPTGDILYTNGPVKTGDRCQAKAQNDYSDRACPTTANIVDIIRGSLVFKTVGGLVEGFGLIIKGIESGVYAIKKVIRIKNTLRKNETKRKEKGEYRYGDIKLNVLIVKDGKSIVGEIQMMTKFMLDAKKMDHELYEIVRRKPFVVSVDEALQLTVNKQQAFVNAAIAGDTLLMSELYINYPEEIDIFKQDDTGKGYSVIHRLCTNGNSRAFALLVRNFVDKENVGKLVGQRSTSGDTPLMIAAANCHSNGHYRILKTLLKPQYKDHVDVNAQNNAGNYALQNAGANGRILAMKTLLKVPGINVNLQDESKYSAIAMTVENCQVEANRLLLANPDVDPNEPIASGSSPLMCACYDGHAPIVRNFLDAKREDIKFNYQRVRHRIGAISFACMNGHTKLVEMMVGDKRVDMNIYESDGNTPIVEAVEGGHYDCVKWMLTRADTDLNFQWSGGTKTTAIMAAAGNGFHEILKLLLEHKDRIDLNLQNSYGQTALDLAKAGEHDECVELLVQAAWT